MEIERYDRSNRNVIRDDVIIIDHISYMLEGNQVSKWYNELQIKIPKSHDYARNPRPKVTVAYSKTYIEGFPKIDVDSDMYYRLPDEQVLPVKFDIERGYKILTDPFKNKHLVLYLKGDYLFEAFNKYKARNATWDLGEYDPLILLESYTQYTEDTISELPLLTGEYFFNIVRYRRFGELINNNVMDDVSVDT